MAKRTTPKEVDKFLDVLMAEIEAARERLNDLEESSNHELAHAVRMAREYAQARFWLAGFMHYEDLMEPTTVVAMIEGTGANDGGRAVLARLQEARDTLADTETKGLLTRLGFYEGRQAHE